MNATAPVSHVTSNPLANLQAENAALTVKNEKLAADAVAHKQWRDGIQAELQALLSKYAAKS